MPERLKPEFGDVDYVPQRVRSAAEFIRNTIKLSSKDNYKDDIVWEDGKTYFPEYREKLESIRRILQRRQALFLTLSSSASSEEIQSLSQFPYTYALASAILINRLYPDCPILTLDEKEKERMLDEAKNMREETNGVIQQPEKLDEVIIYVLEDKLRIETSKKPPFLQIEFGF